MSKNPIKRGNVEILVLTLCSRCESDFENSGHVLVKRGWQEVKEECDYCKVRMGYTYAILSKEIVPKSESISAALSAATEKREIGEGS